MLTTPTDEALLVAALRRGDERAFIELIDRYGPSCCASRRATSAPGGRRGGRPGDLDRVLTGVDRFEGRSSLKTWIFRILTNRAKTRGRARARCVPFSSLASEDEDCDGRRRRGPLPARRRTPAGPARAAGRLAGVPEERLLGRETPEPVPARRSPTSRRASSRSSCCATSRAGPPRRSARRSTSARATSASCCTARARRSAPRWRGTSTGSPSRRVAA